MATRTDITIDEASKILASTDHTNRPRIYATVENKVSKYAEIVKIASLHYLDRYTDTSKFTIHELWVSDATVADIIGKA